MLSEAQKADFLRSVDIYVAPNTGGESFGIILIEAMAAGAAILASDIPAFAEVLQGGEYGNLFTSESVQSLAHNVVSMLKDAPSRQVKSGSALAASERYDWKNVASEISDVYEVALASGRGVSLGSDNRGWKRFKSND